MSSFPHFPHICCLIPFGLVLSTLFRWCYPTGSALIKVLNNLHDVRPHVNLSVFILLDFRASRNTEGHSFLLVTFSLLACVKPHGPCFSSLLATSIICWIPLYKNSKDLQNLIQGPFFWIFHFSWIVPFILMALNNTWSLIIPNLYLRSNSLSPNLYVCRWTLYFFLFN